MVYASVIGKIISYLRQRQYYQCHFEYCHHYCGNYTQRRYKNGYSRQPSKEIDTKSNIHTVVVVGRTLLVCLVIQYIICAYPQRSHKKSCYHSCRHIAANEIIWYHRYQRCYEIATELLAARFVRQAFIVNSVNTI